MQSNQPAKQHPYYPAPHAYPVHPLHHPHAGYYNPTDQYDRKRQRRLTAGSFMQSLFGFKPKPPLGPQISKGGGPMIPHPHFLQQPQHPRPPILIPARGIGPVHDLNENDVLSGRGGRINAHSGNVQFRRLVQARKADYLAKSTKKLDKAHIAAEIVYHIRSLGGRFLKEDEAEGAWYDIGDHKAIKKVGQALREDATDARKDDDEDDDLKKDVKKVNDKKDEEESPTDSSENKASQQEQNKDKSAAEPMDGLVSSTTSCSSSTQPQEKRTSTTVHAPPRMYKPAVTVSGRGAKILSSRRSATIRDTYQPLSYSTDMTTMLPPPSQSFFGRSKAPSVSGAARAIMKETNAAEEAFGRPFHPAMDRPTARVEVPKESSLISGISSLSDVSNPISSLSADLRQASGPQQQQQQLLPQQQLQPSLPQQHLQPSLPQQHLQPSLPQQHLQTSLPQQHLQTSLPQQTCHRPGANSAQQLQQLRHQWATQRQNALLNDEPTQLEIEHMEQASLLIDNMPEDHDQLMMNVEPTPLSCLDPLPVGPATYHQTKKRSRSIGSHVRVNSLLSPSVLQLDVTAEDSLSIHSESLLSVPGSIMSDLSETLMALDLASPNYCL